MPAERIRLTRLRLLQPRASPEFNRSYSNMQEINISLNGIIKLLQYLKPDKAAGQDHIKPLLLQKLCLEIAPVLHVIFSRSLDEDSLPSDWLKATVLSVFEKEDKSSPSNFRPIFLTCILCKRLEHIIASNIVKHLDNSKILYDLQHCSRAKRSWETQITTYVEELYQNMKAGKQPDMILHDFSKALDKVNHEKLISKLHGYAI